MMLNVRSIAALAAGLMTIGALLLVVDRGGLIAWFTLFTGASLVLKTWLKPSRIDLGLILGSAALSIVAWFGTLYYVISTWESGEVVELVIDTADGPHTARLWVLDVGDHPMVYYDAEPQVAQSLLAGKPLQLTRDGVISRRIPRATQVEALPQDEADRILEAMQTKYGKRNDAATLYYGLLGRAHDRVEIVVSLVAA